MCGLKAKRGTELQIDYATGVRGPLRPREFWEAKKEANTKKYSLIGSSRGVGEGATPCPVTTRVQLRGGGVYHLSCYS